MPEISRLVGGALCVIQIVLLYQVLRHDKTHLVPLQLVIAFVAMCM